MATPQLNLQTALGNVFKFLLVIAITGVSVLVALPVFTTFAALILFIPHWLVYKALAFCFAGLFPGFFESEITYWGSLVALSLVLVAGYFLGKWGKADFGEY